MLLYGVTIATSAFLLFLVQPIVAKQILPWFGGSAAVWTTCVLFFQLVLLAGYAYAHALRRLSPRLQAATHVSLLVASLATLPIVASDAWKPLADTDPSARIAGLLVATVGLPYFLLSSTGPLLQRWLADDPARAARRNTIYRLFALSNAGSLVGLVAYPFVVEPFTTLTTQSWAWSATYAVFAVACSLCALRSRRAAPVAAADDATPGPPLVRSAWWVACAALGSTLLLAITNHITQNVASIPFLWIVPLALYLLSFVVVFEGRGGRGWSPRGGWFVPLSASLVAMAWALATHQGVLSIYAAIPIFSVGLFVACVFCHGELAASKPAPRHLTHFYLCLSAGGALGGLFVALVAPRLFDNYWETPIAIAAVALLALATVRERRLDRWLLGIALAAILVVLVFLAAGGEPLAAARATLPGAETRTTTAVLVALALVVAIACAAWRQAIPIALAALVCTSFYGWRYHQLLADDTLQASRTFYGTLRVKQTAAGRDQERRLMHGVILHGNQLTAPDHRRVATSYYGPTSGIALALRVQKELHGSLDVAMVGLGAGTLTAWGRDGDRYRVYELDPAVERVARDWFWYLRDAEATTTIVLGDARLSMERELARPDATRFDVIAIDAFSSDAIPVHLLTREALAIYLRRLKDDGVIAFHVSNRYLDLAPVVARLAEDAGLDAVAVVDTPTDEFTYSASDWILVTRGDDFLDDDEVARRGTPLEPAVGTPTWTDGYNDLLRILK